MSSSITPYTIHVPDEKIQRLKAKLNLTDFPTQFEASNNGDNVPWDFGTPLNDIQRLTKYWKDGYDWRKAERELNQLPNYWTEVEVDGFPGLGLHCMLSLFHSFITKAILTLTNL